MEIELLALATTFRGVTVKSSEDRYLHMFVFGLPQIVVVMLLLAAIFVKFPYGYYIFLRWACFAVFAYLALRSLSLNRGAWAFPLFLVAAVYNPFFRLSLDKLIWSAINFVTAVVLIVTIYALAPDGDEKEEASGLKTSSNGQARTRPSNPNHSVSRSKSEGRVIDSNLRAFLLQSIRESTSSVLIASGWISSNVVDKDFVRILENALARGVDVYLAFGYEDNQGRHELSNNAREALSSLRQIKSKSANCRGSLFVARYNNHEKILIADKATYVTGSFNWLSNSSNTNKDSILVTEDRVLATSEFIRLSTQIRSNLVL